VNLDSIWEEMKEEWGVDARARQAQEKAQAIINGEVVTSEDLQNRIRYVLSRKYNIPFFSEFFENLTLDELFLEVMLITEKEKTPEQKVSEMIMNNKEEVDDLFSDFEEDIPLDLTEDEKEVIKNRDRAFAEKGFEGLLEKEIS
jgi:hypothetical protein